MIIILILLNTIRIRVIKLLLDLNLKVIGKRKINFDRMTCEEAVKTRHWLLIILKFPLLEKIYICTQSSLKIRKIIAKSKRENFKKFVNIVLI